MMETEVTNRMYKQFLDETGSEKTDQFVQQADSEARQARAEAKEALEQVGQNRKAASAYAKVSGRNPKGGQ